MPPKSVFHGRKKIALIIGGLSLLAAAVFTFAPFNLNRALINPLLIESAPVTKQADVGVVLGAGLRPRGQLTDIARERVDAAVLYNENTETDLLFSGGETSYGIESEVMYANAVKQGYDGNKLTEKRSTSTDENASFADDILDKTIPAADEILVITSPYHALRARGVFEQRMPERDIIVYSPNETVLLSGQPFGRWKGLRSLLREYLAIAWYEATDKM